MNTRLLAKIVFGVVLLVLAIILIVNIASSPSGEQPVNTVMPVEETVVDDISTSRVRYTLEGPIVAREEYKEIRITIDKDERIVELIKGYNKRAIFKKSFNNDTKAYESFISGLDFEGFLNEQDNEFDSHIGLCPEGERMIIEYFNEGELVKKLFSTSCSSSQGNLAGDDNDIEDLFEDQIPNLGDLLRNREHRI